MLFNRETIEATKKAVEKWELICNCAGEDKDCALCDMFGTQYGFEDCRGCPIYNFTGTDCTDGTPYKAWHQYWINQSYIPFYAMPKTNPIKQIENLETQEMAIAELELIRKIFIKTLLLWDIVDEYHYKVMRCLDFDEDCKTIIGANATAYCHAYSPEQGYCPFLRADYLLVTDNRPLPIIRTEEVKE